MKISYNLSNKLDIKKSKNIALFCDRDFKVLNLKSLNFQNQNSILKLIKNNKVEDQKLLQINLNDNQNLLVIKISKVQNSLNNEKLGAQLFDFLKLNSITDLTFIDKNFMNKNLSETFVDELFHGMEFKKS